MKPFFATSIIISIAVLTLGSVGLVSCGDSQSTTDIQETGQQVGDVMASIDESGGSTGSLAFNDLNSAHRAIARIAPSEARSPWWSRAVLPQANAASCLLSSTFASCSSNVITRTFGGCTIGAATFDGTVTLTFDDAAVDGTCQMALSGHSVTRVPAFTVTGRRGATLTVSKTGTVGQKITRGSTAGSFTFSNDGIRRVFTTSSGATLIDFTTLTTSDITVTGATRATRTLSGGSLRVTNNLTSVSCDYVPTDVKWTSTCNCPTSGSWAGTCSDGSSTSLSITGCGTASLTVGSASEDFTFDRCYGS